MYVIPHGMSTIPKNGMLGVTTTFIPFLVCISYFRFYCEGQASTLAGKLPKLSQGQVQRVVSPLNSLEGGIQGWLPAL